jgi:hypothetical protein
MNSESHKGGEAGDTVTELDTAGIDPTLAEAAKAADEKAGISRPHKTPPLSRINSSSSVRSILKRDGSRRSISKNALSKTGRSRNSVAFKNRHKLLPLDGTPLQRMILLKMILKVADVSNPTKADVYYQQWMERITAEFHKQGYAEYALDRPVSKFMDARIPNVNECQVGFITYLVRPLVNTLYKSVPSSTTLTSLSETLERHLKEQQLLMKEAKWREKEKIAIAKELAKREKYAKQANNSVRDSALVNLSGELPPLQRQSSKPTHLSIRTSFDAGVSPMMLDSNISMTTASPMPAGLTTPLFMNLGGQASLFASPNNRGSISLNTPMKTSPSISASAPHTHTPSSVRQGGGSVSKSPLVLANNVLNSPVMVSIGESVKLSSKIISRSTRGSQSSSSPNPIETSPVDINGESVSLKKLSKIREQRNQLLRHSEFSSNQLHSPKVRSTLLMGQFTTGISLPDKVREWKETDLENEKGGSRDRRAVYEKPPVVDAGSASDSSTGMRSPAAKTKRVNRTSAPPVDAEDSIKALQHASSKGRMGHRGSIIALQAHQELRQVAALAQMQETTTIAAQFKSPKSVPISPKMTSPPPHPLSPTRQQATTPFAEMLPEVADE